MDQKTIDEFIHVNQEIKEVMERKSSINYDTKVVPRLQFFALKYISQNSGLTVGELADVLMMSSSSIAQLIERLINKGWIKKVEDKDDRRIFHILLTDKGEKEVVKMDEVFFKKMSSMLSLISEQDVKEILRIQKNLLKELKKDKN